MLPLTANPGSAPIWKTILDSTLNNQQAFDWQNDNLCQTLIVCTQNIYHWKKTATDCSRWFHILYSRSSTVCVLWWCMYNRLRLWDGSQWPHSVGRRSHTVLCRQSLSSYQQDVLRLHSTSEFVADNMLFNHHISHDIAHFKLDMTLWNMDNNLLIYLGFLK